MKFYWPSTVSQICRYRFIAFSKVWDFFKKIFLNLNVLCLTTGRNKGRLKKVSGNKGGQSSDM